MGGPQQISISVSRWKKWLSSNVCDAFVLTKIAMPISQAPDMPSKKTMKRIVEGQFKALKIKAQSLVNILNCHFPAIVLTGNIMA
jgi:hypothetical protein